MERTDRERGTTGSTHHARITAVVVSVAALLRLPLGTRWSLRSLRRGYVVAAIIGALTLVNLPLGVAADSSLVGQWLADEGSGSTLVDSSGSGNSGGLQGNPTWVAGQHNQAIRFDGTGDYAVVPDASSLDISGAITIAAWVRPEKLATQYLVKKATQGTSNGYELSLSSAGKAFVRFNQSVGPDTYRINSTTSYPTNGTTWMHVAATYDGTTMKLYVNGVQEGSSIAGPASIATNNVGLGIGAQADGTSQLQGAMDDVHLYSRALSLSEIQALAAAPGGNSAPDAPSAPLPANASTGASTSPTLSVHVSDPDSDPLTVTFFGRPLASGNYTQIAQNTNVTSNTDSTTNAWANLGGGQTFQWYATVKDATHTAVTGPTWTFHTTAGADPVFVGAGDIGSCSVTEDTDTGNIIKGIDGNVFTTGDNVYDSGTAAEFTNCYATTPWGDPSVKSRTRPVPGNHDWGNTGTASDNLNGYFGYYGSNATDGGGKSYYSYDIPASNWHVVNLDSECEDVPGGCAAGSPQEVWLKADLAANSTKNVIALWHKPRYSSGATQYQPVQPLWDDLYAAGVDILLDGHDHIYERTAPMKSGATLGSSPVADPTFGITQFTVGTGGEGHHGLVTPLPTNQVQDDTTFGIFKLTLHASSYDWVFLPVAGSTFTDSGTRSVHAAPHPPGLNILPSGGSLTAGQTVESPNGRYRLTMQGDGNLVEYHDANVAWASGTSSAGSRAVMQGDGNLVVYNASNNALWASGTNGHPGAYLVIGDAGELGVRSTGGATLWAPGKLISTVLTSEQSFTSPNGRYRLTMQGDGNLVEYRGAIVVWASGTSGTGARVVMQDDGNVVVYDGSSTALWASNTSGNPGAYLNLSDSGALSVVGTTGAHLWAGPGELALNATLGTGQTLRSPSGAYRLTMQGDGNLVEQDAANTVVWASGTSGSGARVVMQDDGNLVVYNGANNALWASDTSGHPGAHLSLLDTGQLLVVSATGAPIWAASGALLPGATLASGQTLSSPNGGSTLTMQSDGNLVVRHGSTVAWSSGTSSAGSHAVMQGDGNLVVYSGASAPQWASNSDGTPGAYLVVADDGAIAVLSTTGGTLWSVG